MNTIQLETQFGAQNYKPLPVVLVNGQGIHVWDDQGKKYIDMMSAYSAVSLGHSHPDVVESLCHQAKELSVVSRAYYTDQLGPFLQRACELSQLDKALPMNTGAEAVETALKAARKWGYTVKNIPQGKAEIITCDGNFHGRTIAVVAMSSDEQYKNGFGPFPDGFKRIPYGDPEALEHAITPNTAAFIVEPIQGEAGIIMPPEGYLKACEALCCKHNVLLICDEVQTGLGRTGKLFAYQHEEVQPDGLILGKALGGGVLPVSMFLSRQEVMDVFTPGDHGSTFGGNPLSAAVGLKALDLIVEQKLSEHSAKEGEYFLNELNNIKHPAIKTVRGKGLFIGLEINPSMCTARDVCLKLMDKGLLSKETHHTVVRFAPPLIIEREAINLALSMIRDVFASL